MLPSNLWDKAEARLQRRPHPCFVPLPSLSQRTTQKYKWPMNTRKEVWLHVWLQNWKLKQRYHSFPVRLALCQIYYIVRISTLSPTLHTRAVLLICLSFLFVFGFHFAFFWLFWSLSMSFNLNLLLFWN